MQPDNHNKEYEALLLEAPAIPARLRVGQGAVRHVGRYSPAECIGCKKVEVTGSPDPGHISTSYAGRSNLSMRMSIRRFTRLTDAFSRKVENHSAAVALYFFWHNFGRVHQTSRTTCGVLEKS